MAENLRVAICQFAVTKDITSNAHAIKRFMRKAALANADLIHFPETALPGYERTDFTHLDIDNWQSLWKHTQEILGLASNLGLWVVLGSCRQLADKEKPANCIHVISNSGQIVGTYDKQKLTPAENAWYSSGSNLLIITINNLKCGFLICYDACFPELFESYRGKGVQLIFHSCHNVSRKTKPVLEQLALAQIRTRAADNQLWILASNSSARYSFSKSCIARPDGSIQSLKKHTSGILVCDFPDTELGWTYDNRN